MQEQEIQSLIQHSKRVSALAFFPTPSKSNHSNTLPPIPTTQKYSFYKSSRSSLDTLGDQEWATNSSSNKRRKLSGQSNKSNRPRDQDSSSPFKQVSRRSRANQKSTKTYGSKRTFPPLASSSSLTFPPSQSSSHSTWPPSFEVHERGIPKSELKDRLKTCFITSQQQSTTNSQLDSLVNKALHLFQTYSNVLDAVYTSTASRGRERGTASLQEISARQVGWEIEGRIHDWVNEGSELTMEEMERKLERELSGIEGQGGSDEEEEEVSDETSYLRDEMTRGEQDQACSDIQDEWYEACPAHSFRWILAEHATSILCNGFDQTSAPYGLIETALDLCLSFGATSEASRFQPLLVSQAFVSSASSSSSSNSFLPLLFRSPSPLSLLTTLESHLLGSTFAEKLFYNSYLSISLSLLPSSTSPELSRRLSDYLSLMLGIARVMGNHLIRIYRGSETEEEGLELKAFEKDSREVLERCLKLVGMPPLNSLGLGGRKGRKGKGMNRARKGTLGSLCELNRAGSRESEEFRESVRRLSGLAKEIEEVIDVEDSDQAEEDEDDLPPTLAQQLGSISILLDLAHFLNILSNITLSPAVPHSSTLLIHLFSTHLVPSTSHKTLFSICDSLRQHSPAIVEIQRAMLLSLKETAEGNEDDEVEVEVDRRLRELSEVREESKPRPRSRIKLLANATQYRSSPLRPRLPSSDSSEAESSDSDLIIISASASPSVSPRRPRPSISAQVPLPPPIPTHNSFTSEPDELLLLPPSTGREPPNRPNKRILLNPSPSPPASPSPSPSISDQTSLSPSPPPPPLRSRPAVKNASESKKRRSSSQGFANPSIPPAFRGHVRHKSYDVAFKRVQDDEEEEEDELMM